MATGGRDDSRGGHLKIGTPVPNRIFVGGISGSTNEEDLRNLFSKFGNVKGTKIIVDKAGISKGYGFVTFETEEEAQKVLIEVDCLTLNERKLNIAPAVKKQPYNRTLESNSVHTTPVVWSTQPYAGSAAFPNRDSSYYPQANWSLVWPQLYMPQQCQYPPAPGYAQYVYSIAPDYPYPSAGPVLGSDFSETSSADSGDSGKPRSKPSCSDLDRSRAAPPKVAPSRSPGLPPVLAKTVNGVAVLAYPSSFLMGSPALVHLKEGSAEPDGMLGEFAFLQSAAGSLTPPPTPLASLTCDFSANADSARKN